MSCPPQSPGAFLLVKPDAFYRRLIELQPALVAVPKWYWERLYFHFTAVDSDRLDVEHPSFSELRLAGVLIVPHGSEAFCWLNQEELDFYLKLEETSCHWERCMYIFEHLYYGADSP